LELFRFVVRREADTVRIAIFGGGSIGSRHARNAEALGHTVAVVDPDPSRAKFRPRDFDPSWPDAVMICTPASTHEDVASFLLNRGYVGPLFCEKPVALSSHAPIFSAWPHPVTMVGYNWRFHPDVRLLLELANRRGMLHFDCRTDMRTWPGSGYGDPLLECSHEIDLACAAKGDPVYITGGTLDGDQGAWVQMQHPRGDSVVDVRWLAGQASRRVVLLQKGIMVVADLNATRGTEALDESYRLELEHFLAAVQANQPTACPFSQGLRVVEICEQVRRLAA
jgi:predicted dehydrogenase